MMQEIITYLIGAIVFLIIGRWLWRTLRGEEKGGCTTCNGCGCRESSDCQK